MTLSEIRMIGSSALIVIDMQRGVLDRAWDREGVVARTATLLERARREGVPVIHVQHEVPAYAPMARGGDGWRFEPRVAPVPGEPVVPKLFQDAFTNTVLADMLDALDVTHVVIAGAQSDACIRATAMRAMAEGWRVTLASDCHTTEDREWAGGGLSAEYIVKHTNASMAFVEYPGRALEVVPHESIAFSVMRPLASPMLLAS